MIKRLLLAAAIAGLSTPAVHAALGQHWKFDDNAASTTVVATVGTTATLAGGDNTSVKRVTGPGGSIPFGMLLNGTDDYIDISASSISFTSGNAFSVSVWVKWAATTGAIIGRDADNRSFATKASDTTFSYRGSASTPVLTWTISSQGTTNWHHILLTRTTGNSMRLFCDGSESSTGAQTLANNFGPTAVGRSSATFYSQSLAQLKIFDSDEAANVAALYAEGLTSAGVVPQVISRLKAPSIFDQLARFRRDARCDALYSLAP